MLNPHAKNINDEYFELIFNIDLKKYLMTYQLRYLKILIKIILLQ